MKLSPLQIRQSTEALQYCLDHMAKASYPQQDWGTHYALIRATSLLNGRLQKLRSDLVRLEILPSLTLDEWRKPLAPTELDPDGK